MSCIVEEHENGDFEHVISAISTVKLSGRLESDVSFSHHHIKKDFKSFFNHDRRSQMILFF